MRRMKDESVQMRTERRKQETKEPGGFTEILSEGGKVKRRNEGGKNK